MEIQVTTREAAQALRVSIRTIQRRAKAGSLPAVKAGGRWVITLTIANANFKPRQIDKALELIEDGGIVRVRPRIYRAVSSDGTRTYLTAPQACTCAAGLKGRHMCFHRIAAAILAAA